jgi:phospholipid-binding lipoprotein MlaA
MSLPALTTAMALATAPVNAGEAAPAVIPPVVAPAPIGEVSRPVAASAELPSAASAHANSMLLAAAPPGSDEAAPAAAAPVVDPDAAEPPGDPPIVFVEPPPVVLLDEATDPEFQPTDPAAELEDIVVTGRRADPADPFVEINEEAFDLTQDVDKAFVAPVASVYEKALPGPVRSGIRNFLNNLNEPVVFLNFLLQLKPGKAVQTLGRFTVNSTLGIAGLIDVAKRPPFNRPYRDNGFANTLGYYGVKPGPYFYLPLIGSTTLRDFLGNRVDQIVLPLAGRPFNRPEFAIPAAVLSELDQRVEFDEELRRIRAESDPYAAARETYLKRRQAEIDALRGRPSEATDPASEPARPAGDPAGPPAANEAERPESVP